MTIFLDTTILLDWILDRQDTFADEATEIMLAAEQQKILVYISPGSLYTVVYVLHRSGKRGQILRDYLNRFLSIIEIAAAPRQTFMDACKLAEISDLEDSFQYQIALGVANCQYFVTGNIKDFKRLTSPLIPVVSPAEMVQLF